VDAGRGCRLGAAEVGGLGGRGVERSGLLSQVGGELAALRAEYARVEAAGDEAHRGKSRARRALSRAGRVYFVATTPSLAGGSLSPHPCAAPGIGCAPNATRRRPLIPARPAGCARPGRPCSARACRSSSYSRPHDPAAPARQRPQVSLDGRQRITVKKTLSAGNGERQEKSAAPPDRGACADSGRCL